MTRNDGYLLPAGELSAEELACMLVFYPDRREYRQALLGSILYLGNWLAWERDDDKRGKDAAGAWKLANNATLECLEMACFEELQANVAAILAYLQSQVSCCDDSVTWGPGTEFTTEIEPGEGDAPTHYGQTAVEDWDEWKEYLCHNANLWVDELINTATNIEAALDIGAMSIGVFSSGLAAISFFVIGGAFPVSVLMIGVAALIAGMTANLFSDAADDIEAAREDIVCAIMWGASLSDAVEDAITLPQAWSLFYQYVDYESAAAILYNGGDGETFLPAVKRFDCECIPQPFAGNIYGLSFMVNGQWGTGTIRQMWLQSYDDVDYIYEGASVEFMQAVDPSESAIAVAAGEAGLPGSVYFYSKDAGDFKPSAGRVLLRFKKLNSNNYGVYWHIEKVKAFHSEDGGATGTWYDCKLTDTSGGSYWTVDEVNDTLTFTYTGYGVQSWDRHFSILLKPG